MDKRTEEKEKKRIEKEERAIPYTTEKTGSLGEKRTLSQKRSVFLGRKFESNTTKQGVIG